MIDHRLRVLQVVADRGTISAAADHLGYTPSAVSHQLRTLGRDLGVRLLEPDGRRVRLTPAALTLLARSTDLHALWEEIRTDVLGTSLTGIGHLRLAGFSTAASVLLPSVATAVMRAHPRSTVRILEADPEVCFEMLVADRADLVVVVATDVLPSIDDPRFEQQPLMEDSLDLLVPGGHRLAVRSWVSLTEVAGEPWIMDRPGRPYHHMVSTACAAAGFTPHQVHEVTEWDTGAALVAAGFGVALVPRMARLPADDGLVRVPLRGAATPVRHVRTGVRRGTAGQPEIALALEELRRAADAVDRGDPVPPPDTLPG
ncbi:HTH-type transcriptional regulator GltC [Nocardioides dokdonensis FR1436]|uniref:HTH-type transcriptional regulator GltC n=1 Tax=Nocardioides dokdonensis FR1436 TaxID=1300347 RepID=A0A1A9GMZ6_9ACTN|nr:LysR family transcriptional regulator [Nocardioides dokdonensis]ANH38973.1 HTH-type transcriptional regulator GltC [Nocardioides dokdonensis FR1436]